MEEDYPGSSEVMRRAFEIRDIPKESVNMMIASLTDSSRKQYDGAFKKWWRFCRINNANPFVIIIRSIIQFLT